MEDDPIVREIPVYLDSSLYEQLCLLKFNNKDADKIYKHLFMNPKIKIQNKKFSTGLWFDTNSEEYDQEEGQELAPENEAYLNSIEYESVQSIESSSSVCYMNGDAIYMIPYNTAYSMAPNSQHVNDLVAKQQKEIKEEKADEDVPSGPVGMKMSSIAQQERREENLARKKLESEPWVELKTDYEDKAATTVAIHPFHELCPKKKFGDEAPVPLKWEDYYRKFIIVLPPLEKAILTMLNRAFLITQCQLEKVFHDDSPQDLKDQMQNICVLVQGVWVVKSELLFPKEYKPEYYKKVVDVPIVRYIWDCMLCLFHRKQTIDQNQFTKWLKVNATGDVTLVVTDLLEKIADKSNRTWNFKYQDNSDLKEFKILEREKKKQMLMWKAVKDSGYFTPEAVAHFNTLS